MEHANFAGIALVAILSSISHCAGMCGGFAALQGLFLRGRSTWVRLWLTFSYHAMRVLAYVMIGAMCGTFGGALVLGGASRAALFFVIGLGLVFIGVALWVRGGVLKFIENEQISKFISALMLKFSRKKSGLNFALMGFLNGLLPCGMVYYFAAQAIASGSGLKGALIMAVFGLGTLPALVGLSSILATLGVKFKQVIFKISLVIIIANGIYLTFLGYMANG